ncbi:MAG: aspartate kinase [Schleiferiaceae bacterium]|nr:aspartate kinase [Schleiferiaceae bacterium]
MKVFKFGGASIKDASGVSNALKIVKLFQDSPLTVVISAMGKTTNALEKITANFYSQKDDFKDDIRTLKAYHFNILNKLFDDQDHPVFKKIHEYFNLFEESLLLPRVDLSYSKVYDRLVPFGELLSTTIVHAFLENNGIAVKWLDARELVKTDDNYRASRVLWDQTEKAVKKNIDRESGIYLTQGFIGADASGHFTTLGREGSDYTAAILAYCLDAESVTTWKDVPGILNGDPKEFIHSKLLHQISFTEAIELAYFGASVIHPKTIQPLQRKEIPLYVRSFLSPNEPGTVIKKGMPLNPMMPCFIKKPNQALLKVSTKDLAFIVEDHLSRIYQVFHDMGARVNMMQNSAVSTSFCINHDPVIIPELIRELEKDFNLTYTSNVVLYSVRHYNTKARDELSRGKDIFMEQITRDTYQLVANE